jgi:uncharacterized protein YjeT (DUF2065 family)
VSETEKMAIRIWGIFLLAAGVLIGWQLHGIFQ